MAHFAQLDENNKVINVIVVNNNELLDDNGTESEAKGIAFCKDLFGSDTQWVQTSYNSNFRKNYATLDGSYDPEFDAFIPRKIYDSWKLNYENFCWEPPVPQPAKEEGYFWRWSEVNREWIKLPLE